MIFIANGPFGLDRSTENAAYGASLFHGSIFAENACGYTMVQLDVASADQIHGAASFPLLAITRHVAP